MAQSQVMTKQTAGGIETMPELKQVAEVQAVLARRERLFRASPFSSSAFRSTGRGTSSSFIPEPSCSGSAGTRRPPATMPVFWTSFRGADLPRKPAKKRTNCPIPPLHPLTRGPRASNLR